MNMFELPRPSVSSHNRRSYGTRADVVWPAFTAAVCNDSRPYTALPSSRYDRATEGDRRSPRVQSGWGTWETAPETKPLRSRNSQGATNLTYDWSSRDRLNAGNDVISRRLQALNTDNARGFNTRSHPTREEHGTRVTGKCADFGWDGLLSHERRSEPKLYASVNQY